MDGWGRQRPCATPLILSLSKGPNVPGVTAVADTLDDAIHEAAVALGFAFDDWQGEKPTPRSLDALRSDRDFVASSADAVVATVTPVEGMDRAA